MKTKTTRKIMGAIVALAFTVSTAHAQPSKFYRFWPASFDHGTTSEVVEALISQEFVVVGTAYRAGSSLHVPFLAKYDIGGNILWSHQYTINGIPPGATFCKGMSVATNTNAGEYAFVVYTDNVSPLQSYLIRVDGMGNFLTSTPLGTGEFTSVVYDAGTGNYAVLGSVYNSNSLSFDLEMHLINGAGTIVNTLVYGSSSFYDDRSARLAINPVSGNYTLLGTTFNGTDDDILIVRTNNSGGQLSADYYDFGGMEEAVDLTAGVNGSMTDVMEVLFYDSTNVSPVFLEINDNTGAVINTAEFAVNPSAGVPLWPRAIAFNQVNNTYVMAGSETSYGTQDAVALLFDNNINFMSGNYYGQPLVAGDEGFTDVVYNAGGTPEYVFVGAHQLLGSWPGSGFPPGQFYPWMCMTDWLTNGSCPMPINLSANGLPNTPNIGTQPNVPAPVLISAPVADYIAPQSWLDECTNPFRLQNPANKKTVAEISPNPASSQVTIAFDAAQDATFELFNALGESVMKQTIAAGTSSSVIDISQLPAGLYTYRLMSNDAEIQKEKLVITR